MARLLFKEQIMIEHITYLVSQCKTICEVYNCHSQLEQWYIINIFVSRSSLKYRNNYNKFQYISLQTYYSWWKNVLNINNIMTEDRFCFCLKYMSLTHHENKIISSLLIFILYNIMFKVQLYLV